SMAARSKFATVCGSGPASGAACGELGPSLWLGSLGVSGLLSSIFDSGYGPRAHTASHKRRIPNRRSILAAALAARPPLPAGLRPAAALASGCAMASTPAAAARPRAEISTGVAMSVQDEIRRLTAPDIRARKRGDPIVCLTSYHAHTARLVDKYCDVILVGD